MHVTALGALDFGGAPMQRDTIFRIASMTKPVAAAVTMQLVEEGAFALDEPVGRLLPEFAAPRVLTRLEAPLDETVPAGRPIIVEDLLTMRMGTGAIMTPGDYPLVGRWSRAAWRRGRRCPNCRCGRLCGGAGGAAAGAAAGGGLAV